MARELWLPGADRSVRHEPKHVSMDTRYPARGVIHTTETHGLPGYGPGWAPTATFMPDGYVYQHNPLNVCSGSLRNVYPGHPDEQYDTGIDPDRTGLINVQFELVGYAAGRDAPDAQISAVADAMWFIESQWPLPAKLADVEWGVGDQYGYENPYELSLEEWLNLNAWVGHQHVPENTHYDPGKAVPRELKERLQLHMAFTEHEVHELKAYVDELDKLNSNSGFLFSLIQDIRKNLITQDELDAAVGRVSSADTVLIVAKKAESKADRANRRLDSLKGAI